MSKTKTQRRARELQKRTSWSYMECLRVVQNNTDEQVNAIVRQRFEEGTLLAPKKEKGKQP